MSLLRNTLELMAGAAALGAGWELGGAATNFVFGTTREDSGLREELENIRLFLKVRDGEVTVEDIDEDIAFWEKQKDLTYEERAKFSALRQYRERVVNMKRHIERVA